MSSFTTSYDSVTLVLQQYKSFRILSGISVPNTGKLLKCKKDFSRNKKLLKAYNYVKIFYPSNTVVHCVGLGIYRYGYCTVEMVPVSGQ